MKTMYVVSSRGRFLANSDCLLLLKKPSNELISIRPVLLSDENFKDIDDVLNELTEHYYKNSVIRKVFEDDNNNLYVFENFSYYNVASLYELNTQQQLLLNGINNINHDNLLVDDNILIDFINECFEVEVVVKENYFDFLEINNINKEEDING